jgi:hypothetical protein
VRLNRILIGLAALAVVCGCGGTTSTSTSTSTSTQSPKPSPCQADTDSVQPGEPLIEVSPTGAAKPTTLTKQARLTCYATLSVAEGGSATATFGTVAACVLTQIGSPNGGVGTLVSRYPPNMLFSLVQGMVTCASSPAAQGQEAYVCGKGTVHLTNISASWNSTCADHRFWVAVYRGSVQVDYPSGQVTLHPLSQLAFDPSTSQGKVSTRISFPAAEISIFDSLKP